jgi:hypothetical protein
MTHCILLLVALLPGAAFAQCSTSQINDDTNIGIRSFGRQFAENLNVEIGNSFVLDCAAQFLSVEVTLVLGGGAINEHPPLAVGDTVYCDIRDADRGTIVSEELTVALGDAPQKLTFDFSAHEFKLPAGQYYFMIGTLQDRYGYVQLGSDYPDGAAQVTIDNVWYEQTGDTMFRMYWDPDSAFVPTQGLGWSAMKAQYR